MMKAFALLVAGALLLSGVSRAETGAAEETYSQVCSMCHGPTGKGMASFPKLAGREAAYIASRLGQYRSGEEVGPNTALMAPHAAKLTDDEIDALAAYISTL